MTIKLSSKSRNICCITEVQVCSSRFSRLCPNEVNSLLQKQNYVARPGTKHCQSISAAKRPRSFSNCSCVIPAGRCLTITFVLFEAIFQIITCEPCSSAISGSFGFKQPKLVTVMVFWNLHPCLPVKFIEWQNAKLILVQRKRVQKSRQQIFSQCMASDHFKLTQ